MLASLKLTCNVFIPVCIHLTLSANSFSISCEGYAQMVILTRRTTEKEGYGKLRHCGVASQPLQCARWSLISIHTAGHIDLGYILRPVTTFASGNFLLNLVAQCCCFCDAGETSVACMYSRLFVSWIWSAVAYVMWVVFFIRHWKWEDTFNVARISARWFFLCYIVIISTHCYVH